MPWSCLVTVLERMLDVLFEPALSVALRRCERPAARLVPIARTS